MFYTNLDNRISLFNVYNVLTMADDFMVVSGMPQDIGDRHAVEIASLALDLLASTVVFQIAHQPSTKLNIKMGFNRFVFLMSLARVSCILLGLFQYNLCYHQRTGHWCCGGNEDAKLLRHVGHRQHRQAD